MRTLVMGGLVLAVLVIPAGARADWPHSPTADVPLGAAVYGTQRPLMIPDGQGGALVVWEDVRVADGDLGLYATRVMATGSIAPGWPAGGAAVCAEIGDQQSAVAVPDSQGGAFVAWQDDRNGSDLDVYATRISATGAVAAGWPAAGRPVCTAPGDQRGIALVADGAGGVYVAWQDARGASLDVFAQRLAGNGELAAGWPLDGLAVCRAAGDQRAPQLVGDGQGGAMIVWEDLRSGEGDIYATRLLAPGYVSPYWPFDGQPMCNAPGDQRALQVAPDGEGGVLAVWQDLRNGEADVYAGHLAGDPVFPPNWSSDGLPVCTHAGPQGPPVIAADGSGGAFIAWSDAGFGPADLYAQHLTGGGAVHDGWLVDGAPVCSAPGDQFDPAIVSDGAGGAILAWRDLRWGATGDIVAARVSADHAGYVGWPVDGRPVCTAVAEQQHPALIADPDGNALVAWSDARGAAGVAVQRVDHYGVLGDPAPVMAGVRDVPNDQGGVVQVAWQASWLDQPIDDPIASYWVMRSLSADAAREALADGRASLSPGTRPLLVSAAGGWWERVADTPVLNVSGYAVVVPTTSDSGARNPRTLFMVQARTAAGVPFWSSAPDSGYSVDNLAPAAPGAVSGRYAAGASTLAWHPNDERDLEGYRVYRGGTPDFALTPEARIATVTGTGFVDACGAPAAYAITAVDAHGNESAPARLLPSGTARVDDTGAGVVLESPRPSPSVGHARVGYTLPRAGAARLDVLDAAGRHVCTLVEGAQTSGRHEALWDGRSSAGADARPGIYWLRLEAAGRVRTARVLLTR